MMEGDDAPLSVDAVEEIRKTIHIESSFNVFPESSLLEPVQAAPTKVKQKKMKRTQAALRGFAIRQAPDNATEFPPSSSVAPEDPPGIQHTTSTDFVVPPVPEQPTPPVPRRQVESSPPSTQNAREGITNDETTANNNNHNHNSNSADESQTVLAASSTAGLGNVNLDGSFSSNAHSSFGSNAHSSFGSSFGSNPHNSVSSNAHNSPNNNNNNNNNGSELMPAPGSRKTVSLASVAEVASPPRTTAGFKLQTAQLAGGKQVPASVPEEPSSPPITDRIAQPITFRSPVNMRKNSVVGPSPRLNALSTARRLSTAIAIKPPGKADSMPIMPLQEGESRIVEIVDEDASGSRQQSQIQAFVRFRPPPEGHHPLPEDDFEIDDTLVSLTSADANGNPRSHEFDVTRVFGAAEPQEEVFQAAALPMVSKLFEGYNVTMLFFGELSSGKTFTCIGDHSKDDLKGVAPRMLDDIFAKIAALPQDSTATVTMSYLETYKEQIIDLLNAETPPLFLKETKKGPLIEDKHKEVVTSTDMVINLLTEGNRNMARKWEMTPEHRSHRILVFNLRVEYPRKGRRGEATITEGELQFVDLAGMDYSESALDQSSDAKLSRQALAVLNNVVRALSEKTDANIPYRSSKLTHYLKRSLGGNSHTAFFVTCLDTTESLQATIRSLEFAQRVKNVSNVVQKRVLKKTLVTDEDMQRERIREEVRHEVAAKIWSQATKEMNRLQEMHEREFEANLSRHAQELNKKIEQMLAQEVAKYEQEVLNFQKQYTEEIDSLKRELDSMDDEIATRDAHIENLESQLLLMQEFYEHERTQLKLRPSASRMSFHPMGSFSRMDSEGAAEPAPPNQLASNTRLGASATEYADRVTNLEKELMHTKILLNNSELKLLQIQRANALTMMEGALHVPLRGMGRHVLPPGLNKETAFELLKSKFSVELETLRKGTILEQFGGYYPLPAAVLDAKREGFLLEKDSAKEYYCRRFFVIEDGMLLKYEESNKDDLTPLGALPLEGCKISSYGLPQKKFSFILQGVDGDRFVLVATSEEEKQQWVHAIKISRQITHKAMVQTAVSTKFLLDGIQDPTEQSSLRRAMRNDALAIFENIQYVTKFPLDGKHFGWLECNGPFKAKGKTRGAPQWQRLYFALQGSHLRAYDVHRTTLTTQPVGVLHLAYCQVKKRTAAENFEIEIQAADGTPILLLRVTSGTAAERWVMALKVASRLTHKNLMLLAQTREAVTLRIHKQSFLLDVNQIDEIFQACARAAEENSKTGFQHSLISNDSNFTITRKKSAGNLSVGSGRLSPRSSVGSIRSRVSQNGNQGTHYRFGDDGAVGSLLGGNSNNEPVTAEHMFLGVDMRPLAQQISGRFTEMLEPTELSVAEALLKKIEEVPDEPPKPPTAVKFATPQSKPVRLGVPSPALGPARPHSAPFAPVGIPKTTPLDPNNSSSSDIDLASSSITPRKSPKMIPAVPAFKLSGLSDLAAAAAAPLSARSASVTTNSFKNDEFFQNQPTPRSARSTRSNSQPSARALSARGPGQSSARGINLASGQSGSLGTNREPLTFAQKLALFSKMQS